MSTPFALSQEVLIVASLGTAFFAHAIEALILTWIECQLFTHSIKSPQVLQDRGLFDLFFGFTKPIYKIDSGKVFGYLNSAIHMWFYCFNYLSLGFSELN